MIYSAKPFGSEDALSLAFYCRFRKTKYKFSNTTVYEDLGGGCFSGLFFFVVFFARWNIFMAKYLLIMIVKSFVISSVHIIVVNI